MEQRLALASISGTSFADDNGNGVHDAAESPLAGITVFLDQNNNRELDAGEASTLTNAAGQYAFHGLGAGEYIVRQENPADRVTTTPLHDGSYYAYLYIPGSNGLMQPGRIDPDTGTVQRFGSGADARLHAMVRTNDGEFYGLNGWNPDRFYQLDFPTNTQTEIGELGGDAAWGMAYDTETDTIYGLVNDPSDGNLLKLVTIDRATGAVTYLGPGTNQLTGTSGIAFDPQRNVVVAFDNNDDQFWEFDLAGNPTLIWDTTGLDGWGFAHDGESFVLHARLVDDGNPNLSNRLLWRLDPYSKTVSDEFFQASEAVPMEALDFFLVEEGHMVVVDANGTHDDLYFGVAAPHGVLSGSIYDDHSGDGERDSGEPALAGVTVYLDLNGNGVLDSAAPDSEPTAVTSADGNYLFSQAPLGDHILRVDLPSGFEQTSPASGEARLFATTLSIQGQNSIREIDPLTGATLQDINIPGYQPHNTNGLAFDGTTLYAIHSNGTVYEVDPDSSAVTDTWSLPSHRWDGAAVLDGQLYLNDPLFDQIRVIDPATNTNIRTISFPPGSNFAPFGALGEFVSSTGVSSILGSIGASSGIAFLDPIDGAVQRTIMHGPYGSDYGLTGVDGEIYVGYDSSPGFVEVFAENGAVQRTFQLGERVTGLAGGVAGISYYQVTVTPGSAEGDLDFGLRATDGGPRGVVDRHVFYNGSRFDGRDPAANPLDDLAIAPNKHVLLPGESASAENYTTSHRGINGLMIDIGQLPAGLTADDFEFRVGNSHSPEAWTLAPPPVSITVRPGAGSLGTDRVTLIWPDGAIRNTWLAVNVKANANSGLLHDDHFYIGNLVGDANGDGVVNSTDFALIRSNPHNFRNPATADSPLDLNRDARVNGADLIIVRDGASSLGSGLSMIGPGNFKAGGNASLGSTTPVVVSSTIAVARATSATNDLGESALVDDPASGAIADDTRAALLSELFQSKSPDEVEWTAIELAKYEELVDLALA